MHPSSEIASGSEESNAQKIKNFKEKAIEILNNENIINHPFILPYA